MLITGLRGVGKTVLLNTFEAIAEEQGFRTAKSEITHETEFRPLIARLARRALLAVSPAKRMKERARRAAAIFKAFTLRTPEGLAPPIRKSGVHPRPAAPGRRRGTPSVIARLRLQNESTSSFSRRDARAISMSFAR